MTHSPSEPTPAISQSQQEATTQYFDDLAPAPWSSFARDMRASNNLRHELNLLGISDISRTRFNDWLTSYSTLDKALALDTNQDGRIVLHDRLYAHFIDSENNVRQQIEAQLTQDQFDMVTLFDVLMPANDKNLDVISYSMKQGKYRTALDVMHSMVRFRYRDTPIYPTVWRTMEAWYCPQNGEGSLRS